MSIVIPAVLPSSRAELLSALDRFASIPSVDTVQIDVVDGRFAAPASWPYNSPTELESYARSGRFLPHLDRISYEIDLMCLDAEAAAAHWLALGAFRLTFHAESVPDLRRLLESVRSRYAGAVSVEPLVSLGLALNLGSDLALIEPFRDQISYVQIMGIAKIGRQGQPFDERALEKVRILRERLPNLSIQVDGGVSLERARELLALGVSRLVVGSAILRAENPAKAVAAFEALENPYGV